LSESKDANFLKNPVLFPLKRKKLTAIKKAPGFIPGAFHLIYILGL